MQQVPSASTTRTIPSARRASASTTRTRRPNRTRSPADRSAARTAIVSGAGSSPGRRGHTRGEPPAAGPATPGTWRGAGARPARPGREADADGAETGTGRAGASINSATSGAFTQPPPTRWAWWQPMTRPPCRPHPHGVRRLPPRDPARPDARAVRPTPSAAPPPPGHPLPLQATARPHPRNTPDQQESRAPTAPPPPGTTGPAPRARSRATTAQRDANIGRRHLRRCLADVRHDLGMICRAHDPTSS